MKASKRQLWEQRGGDDIHVHALDGARLAQRRSEFRCIDSLTAVSINHLEDRSLIRLGADYVERVDEAAESLEVELIADALTHVVDSAVLPHQRDADRSHALFQDALVRDGRPRFGWIVAVLHSWRQPWHSGTRDSKARGLPWQPWERHDARRRERDGQRRQKEQHVKQVCR